MTRSGSILRYFTGVAAKRLSGVEADFEASHQHEFNGVDRLKRILGSAPEKQKFAARFVYLADGDDAHVADDGFVTWYDARASHPTRSEHRLYFPRTLVSERMREGDLAVFAVTPRRQLYVFIAAAGSTYERHLTWLFELDDDQLEMHVQDYTEGEHRPVGYAERIILEELGIETVETADENWLEVMVDRFGGAFPTTKAFSAFARETAGDLNVVDDADAALIEWLDHEERLFRLLERHIVGEEIRNGFEDVDSFVSFSLSVHNRRKARAGLALENHVQHAFEAHGVAFCRGCETEKRKRPDYLLPGKQFYRDPLHPADRLAMLGVKSSCKDRWRQVLSEADRIPVKHLLTLEPGISENQTDEMQSAMLRLVVPRGLHVTYTAAQRDWLMGFDDFIRFARDLSAPD